MSRRFNRSVSSVSTRTFYRCALLLSFFGLNLPPVAAQVMAQSLPTLTASDSTSTRIALPKPTEVAPQTPNLMVLTGQVLDAAGKPLPGATATVEGTEWLAVTDANGSFALPVQAFGLGSSTRVRCSYVGLSDQLLDVSLGVEQIVFLMKEGHALPAAKSRTTGRMRDL